MKKKILCLALCTVISGTALNAWANEPVISTIEDEIIEGKQVLTVDGKNVDISALPAAYDENGCVMVPLRAVAEAMGYDVEWNSEEKSVEISDGEWAALAYIGEDSYTAYSKTAIGMTAPQNYGAAAVIVDGTTFVPADMFELLDYSFNSMGQFMEFTSSKEDENMQIANPFTEYKTAEEMNEKVGFTAMEIGKLPFEVENKVYIGSDFGLAQTVYGIGEDKTVLLRQEKNMGDIDDISGDYNEYPDIKTVDQITLKGKNGSYSLAVWRDDEYLFSLSSDIPVSENDILYIINSLS